MRGGICLPLEQMIVVTDTGENGSSYKPGTDGCKLSCSESKHCSLSQSAGKRMLWWKQGMHIMEIFVQSLWIRGP